MSRGDEEVFRDEKPLGFRRVPVAKAEPHKMSLQFVPSPRLLTPFVPFPPFLSSASSYLSIHLSLTFHDVAYRSYRDPTAIPRSLLSHPVVKRSGWQLILRGELSRSILWLLSSLPRTGNFAESSVSFSYLLSY